MKKVSNGNRDVAPSATFRHYLGVWLLYLILVIVASWPLILQFRTAVPGHPWLSVKIHLWQFWWTREALLSAKEAFFRTHLLYFPDGLDTLTEMGNFLLPILSVPFQMLFGLAGGYNAVFLAAFAAAGTAVYALCASLGVGRPACFVGGAAFTFLPYAWMKVFDAEFEIAVLVWLPVCVFQIGRCLDRPCVSRGLVLGLLLFLSAMSSWYYGFFLAVAAPIAGLLYAAERAREKRFKTAVTMRALAALAVGVALHSALMLPFALELGKTKRVSDLNWIRASRKWDLEAKANPDVLELIAPWQRAPSDRDMEQVAEFGIPYPFAVFPGFLTLFLALYGLRSRPRIPSYLWGGAWFFWIVSLGPWLKIGASGGLLPPRLPLPAYHLASHSHAFAAITIHSYRAAVLLLLLLSVLAAVGFDRIVRQLGVDGARRSLVCAAVAVIMGLGALDAGGLSRPLRRTDTVIPAVYDRLGETRGFGAVADIPVTEVDHVVAEQMLAQTRHGRPILAGRSYETRFPGPWGNLLDGLYYRAPKGQTEEAVWEPAVRVAGLAAKGVRFFVVHWRWLPESRARDVRAMLESTCATLAEDEGNGITIYEADAPRNIHSTSGIPAAR